MKRVGEKSKNEVSPHLWIPMCALTIFSSHVMYILYEEVGEAILKLVPCNCLSVLNISAKFSRYVNSRKRSVELKEEI